MNKTQQLIQDAIDGGWESDFFHLYDLDVLDSVVDHIEKAFLDPKFWQAVGETRGWGETINPETGNLIKHKFVKSIMYEMIDHLISGKTLQDFIETL